MSLTAATGFSIAETEEEKSYRRAPSQAKQTPLLACLNTCLPFTSHSSRTPSKPKNLSLSLSPFSSMGNSNFGRSLMLLLLSFLASSCTTEHFRFPIVSTTAASAQMAHEPNKHTARTQSSSPKHRQAQIRKLCSLEELRERKEQGNEKGLNSQTQAKAPAKCR